MNRLWSRLLPCISACLFAATACGDDARADRYPSLNESPEAILSIPVSAEVGEDVLFDASQSADPDGRIVRYTFDPGVEDVLIITADDMVSYRYEASGEYVVRLFVEDDDGSRAAVAATLSVLAGAVISSEE